VRVRGTKKYIKFYCMHDHPELLYRQQVHTFVTEMLCIRPSEKVEATRVRLYNIITTEQG